MKIVAVMTMRNEADIIESWIRYYYRVADHILITDNLSMDGSDDLVLKLADEGLPISLIRDNRPGHLQQERMEIMMNHAFYDLEADWVLLLDADEFLIPPMGETLRDIFIELNQNQTLKVPWVTYVPTINDPGEPNVLKRVSHRLQKEVKQIYKVMVPVKIGKNKNVLITMGNHDIRIGKKRVKCQEPPSGMVLAHFPVRSRVQISTKILVGWLSTLSSSRHTGGKSYHWKNLFDRIIENKEEAFLDLERAAVNYLGEPIKSDEGQHVVRDPIEDSLSDFTIKYVPASTSDPFKVFAATAEQIATNYGNLSRQVELIRSGSKMGWRNFFTRVGNFFFSKNSNKDRS